MNSKPSGILVWQNRTGSIAVTESRWTGRYLVWMASANRQDWKWIATFKYEHAAVHWADAV